MKTNGTKLVYVIHYSFVINYYKKMCSSITLNGESAENSSAEAEDNKNLGLYFEIILNSRLNNRLDYIVD